MVTKSKGRSFCKKKERKRKLFKPKKPNDSLWLCCLLPEYLLILIEASLFECHVPLFALAESNTSKEKTAEE